MLDTNIVSDVIRNSQGPVARRIADIGEASVCTSVIVTAELRFGAA
jgi:tRNA(fMet)-specific endonuclease VapC